MEGGERGLEGGLVVFSRRGAFGPDEYRGARFICEGAAFFGWLLPDSVTLAPPTRGPARAATTTSPRPVGASGGVR